MLILTLVHNNCQVVHTWFQSKTNHLFTRMVSFIWKPSIHEEVVIYVSKLCDSECMVGLCQLRSNGTIR